MSALSDQIINYIREHDLKPGDAMPTEIELMKDLQVSRSKAREALRELRALGVVKIRHGYGTTVGSADMNALTRVLNFRTTGPGADLIHNLHELVMVRTYLEVELTREVCLHSNPALWEELRQVASAMHDAEDPTQLDRQFHQLLYRDIDNLLAKQLIESFWEVFNTSKEDLLPAHDLNANAAIHQAIVDACASGDEIQAMRAMRDHFRHIEERLARASRTVS